MQQATSSNNAATTVSPLLKIIFIQRILKYSTTNVRRIVRYCAVHPEWRVTILDFSSFPLLLTPLLAAQQNIESLKKVDDDCRSAATKCLSRNSLQSTSLFEALLKLCKYMRIFMTSGFPGSYQAPVSGKIVNFLRDCCTNNMKFDKSFKDEVTRFIELDDCLLSSSALLSSRLADGSLKVNCLPCLNSTLYHGRGGQFLKPEQKLAKNQSQLRKLLTWCLAKASPASQDLTVAVCEALRYEYLHNSLADDFRRLLFFVTLDHWQFVLAAASNSRNKNSFHLFDKHFVRLEIVHPKSEHIDENFSLRVFSLQIRNQCEKLLTTAIEATNFTLVRYLCEESSSSSNDDVNHHSENEQQDRFLNLYLTLPDSDHRFTWTRDKRYQDVISIAQSGYIKAAGVGNLIIFKYLVTFWRKLTILQRNKDIEKSLNGTLAPAPTSKQMATALGVLKNKYIDDGLPQTAEVEETIRVSVEELCRTNKNNNDDDEESVTTTTKEVSFKFISGILGDTNSLNRDYSKLGWFEMIRDDRVEMIEFFVTKENLFFDPREQRTCRSIHCSDGRKMPYPEASGFSYSAKNYFLLAIELGAVRTLEFFCHYADTVVREKMNNIAGDEKKTQEVINKDGVVNNSKSCMYLHPPAGWTTKNHRREWSKSRDSPVMYAVKYGIRSGNRDAKPCAFFKNKQDEKVGIKMLEILIKYSQKEEAENKEKFGNTVVQESANLEETTRKNYTAMQLSTVPSYRAPFYCMFGTLSTKQLVGELVDHLGYSPLHFALRLERYEIAKLLLQYGGEEFWTKNFCDVRVNVGYRYTTIDVACSKTPQSYLFDLKGGDTKKYEAVLKEIGIA